MIINAYVYHMPYHTFKLSYKFILQGVLYIKMEGEKVLGLDIFCAFTTGWTLYEKVLNKLKSCFV